MQQELDTAGTITAEQPVNDARQKVKALFLSCLTEITKHQRAVYGAPLNTLGGNKFGTCQLPNDRIQQHGERLSGGVLEIALER